MIRKNKKHVVGGGEQLNTTTCSCFTNQFVVLAHAVDVICLYHKKSLPQSIGTPRQVFAFA